MKEATVLAIAAVLVSWLVWNIVNVYRLVKGLTDRSWRRPMWWLRAGSVFLFIAATAWTRGIFSGGLDISETCQFTYHETYDDVYWEKNRHEFQRLFPLHNKCNEHFDLVPSWVNPTIVVCSVIAVICAAVLAGFGIASLTSKTRKGNQS